MDVDFWSQKALPFAVHRCPATLYGGDPAVVGGVSGKKKDIESRFVRIHPTQFLSELRAPSMIQRN